MKQETTGSTRQPPTHLDAAQRMTKRMTDMDGTKTEGLHPSYQRLIEAAAKMRGIYGETAISVALHSNDPQKVNNWQRRGVSKDGALDAERYLGIPAVYILNDTIPPCEEWQRLRAANRIESPVAVYKNNELRELNELAEAMDQDSLRALVLLMKKL